MDTNTPIAASFRIPMRPNYSRLSARRFRHAIELSPVGFRFFRPDGRCIYANRAAALLTGTRLEDATDYNILQDDELHACGAIPLVERGFAGEATRLPDLLYDPARNGLTGRPRWVRSHLLPIKTPNGAVSELVQVLEDVTDSRILIEALSQREAQFRTVAETIPHLVYTCDANGRGTFVNQRWIDYTGLRPSQARGLGWLQSVHPDDVAHTVESWNQARAAGRAHETAFRLRRRDGVYRWHLARAWPMRDASGAINHWFGTLTDIEEQKQAEDRQRFLADAGSILSASLDYERMASEIAELTAAQFSGCCRIYHCDGSGEPTLLAEACAAPDQRPQLTDPKCCDPSTVLRAGKPLLYVGATDNDANPTSAIGTPLQARGRVFGALLITSGARRLGKDDLGLASELAARLALALDNAALYHQARASLRMRDDFIGIVSHELRTPLTTIRLQTQMTKRLLDRGNPDALSPQRMRHLVEQTDRQVERLSRLVDEMLDLTRINAGKLTIQLERFDLAELAAEMLERFADQLRTSGCEVSFEAPAPVVGCWDRYRMEQVLANLLTNAAKYGAQRPIRVRVLTQGDHAVLTVQDHGVGIDAKDQARIFEPFERAGAPQNTGGLGLGLYIVRRILERLGGEISVDSERGRGATFIVRLPLTPPNAEEQSSPN